MGRESSNHSDNSRGIFDEDSQGHKELEDELRGIFAYRFEPYSSDEEEDSEEEPMIPTDIDRLQNIEWYCTLLFISQQVNTGLAKVRISVVKQL